MIIKEKLGNLNHYDLKGRHIDWLELEWFETRKRILRKKSRAGQEIALKFLTESAEILQDDILFQNEFVVVAVEIMPCDCMVVKTANMFETASLCYEIGNKHAPLFWDEGNFLVPYETPLFRQLTVQGYQVSRSQRKLLHPLKTTVSPHADQENTSLFSKIMQLTT